MNLLRLWRWITGQSGPGESARDDQPWDLFALTERGLFGTGALLRVFPTRAEAEEARYIYRDPDSLCVRRMRPNP